MPRKSVIPENTRHPGTPNDEDPLMSMSSQYSGLTDPFSFSNDTTSTMWDPTLIAWIAESRACLWSPALRAAGEAARQTPRESRMALETALVCALDANIPADPGFGVHPPERAEAAFAVLRWRTEDRIAKLLAEAVEALIPASPECQDPVQPREIRWARDQARRALSLFPVPPGSEPLPRHQIIQTALDTLSAVLDHTLAVPAPDAEVWGNIKVMARAAVQQREDRRIAIYVRDALENVPEVGDPWDAQHQDIHDRARQKIQTWEDASPAAFPEYYISSDPPFGFGRRESVVHTMVPAPAGPNAPAAAVQEAIRAAKTALSVIPLGSRYTQEQSDIHMRAWQRLAMALGSPLFERESEPLECEERDLAPR